MSSSEQYPAPIGGAIYRKPGLRGTWRVETAGPKWVTFRSLAISDGRGSWVRHREPRATWPNGWERA